MTEQPTALYLAEILQSEPGAVADAASAELRRLHAENESLKNTLAASCDEEREQLYEANPGGGCARALSAEFQRDQLLEALKNIDKEFAKHGRQHWPEAVKARAVIKAVEGEKT